MSLRKVKYRLCDKVGVEWDEHEEEKHEIENLCKEKDGWFHTWTQVSEQDSQSESVLIKAYGVIETENHELLELPIRWFKFYEDE